MRILKDISEINVIVTVIQPLPVILKIAAYP